MNDKTMLDGIEPEVMKGIVSRREALRRGAFAGGALTAALRMGSAPVAIAALSRDVYGQAPATVVDVLLFALLLENLEAEFYKAVLGQSSAAAVNTAFASVRATLTAQETATFDQIRKHEVAHVAFLRTAISGAGGTPPTYAATDFDFTGGNGSGTGPFLAATADKAFLLAGAQAFEDTGVRAYKGQAGNLISDNTVLEAALRIHSVEARHAAKIRKMRSAAGAPVDPSGTITGRQSGITGVPAPGQAVVDSIYAGATPEDNTSHVVFNGSAAATLNAAMLPNITGGVNSVTEAFDEPLTREEVTAIVAPFIVGSNP
ncbi:MAG: ferritin-like domain-containing protein [Longimicrobiales bacterium]